MSSSTAPISEATPLSGRVFAWEPQPLAAADYLFAPHGDEPGVDAGILASR